MGLLGVLSAGAARGGRDASNMNVQEANIDRREALRQHYEMEKYGVKRKDAIQDAEAAGRAGQQQYERERADKLSDTESEREFTAGESKKERESKYSIAALRAKGSGGKGGGGKEVTPGTRSAIGKQINDMIDNGLAGDPEEAWDRLVEKGMVSGMAANQFISDPKELFSLLTDIRKERAGSKSGEPSPREFVKNPKTGAYEPAK